MAVEDARRDLEGRASPYVVAISGPVGGGKTSLVRGLLSGTPEASAIFLDHYETFTRRPIAELKEWIRKGADFDAIAIPRLTADLARLGSGGSVTDPATGGSIGPARILFFETLYGRAHTASAPYIDFLVWVDTPLDVALARNLIEFSRRFAGEPGRSHEQLRWLEGYLQSYLEAVRPLLALQRDRVCGAADLVLDGREPPEALVRRVRHELHLRLA